MAYQNGSLSTGANIIDNLDSFATSNGFTKAQKYTSGDWYILALSQGADYWHIGFNDVTDELGVSFGTGHTSSGAWVSHAGENTDPPYCNEMSNFSQYHFFADSTSIKCVVVLADGQHKHFVFGYTSEGGVKGYPIAGAFYWYTFAPYVSTYPSSYHGCLFGYAKAAGGALGGHSQICVNSKIYKFGEYDTDSNHGVNPAKAFAAGPFGDTNAIMFTTPSTYNHRAVTEPVLLMINDLGSEELYQPCGEVQGMKLVNIEQLNAGDALDATLTDWLVFPHLRKGSGDRMSGDYGLAFKK